MFGKTDAAVFVANCENCKQAQHAITNVQEHLKDANLGGPIIILGPSSIGDDCISLGEYIVQLFRSHNLHKNEREMVLTHEDQLLAVQLCVADYNKEVTGEYDVEVSRVLEIHRKLISQKLSFSSLDADCEYEKIKEMYDDFLKSNNVVDLADVLCQVKDEMKNNEVLQKQIQESSVLFLTMPSGTIEDAFAELMRGGKPIHRVVIETSLDASILDGNAAEGGFSVVIEDATWEEMVECEKAASNSPIFSPTGRKSVTEAYVEKVLYGYLHLLVNTRSELGLARVINVPDRKLNHDAFTVIKREAKKKRMSMYQTMISFVMRLRLGGSSYKPDVESDIGQHVKGISEFTDLAHKLQTIVEEDTSSRSAVKKVLNTIKNLTLRSEDTLLRKESITAATERLLRHAERIFEFNEKHVQPSPARTVSNGGSVGGRRTVRVLRSLVDRFSGQAPSSKNMDILTDSYSSQRTPLRFPSVISQFRSPVEHSPEALESKSLSERIVEKELPKKKPLTMRYQSNMDWASPLHKVGIKKEVPLEDFIPCKSIAHPAAPSRLSTELSQNHQHILASLNDQENADSTLHTEQRKQGKGQVTKKSSKRSLADTLSSQPAAKKPKTAPASKKSAPKKKNMPLQKGQKQLTAFFRI